MRASNTRLLLVATSALTMLGAAGPTLAATAADNAAASADVAQVGEITVTARHREETMQSVPIAISVVDGAKTAQKNLNDIGDISSQVPSVQFRTGASNKDRTVFIRGAGTISTSPGVEPSVSTVIDGVVLARPGQATVDLLDLDHIEVLRGPQGTLFGKNASAGVVNILTKNPTSNLTGAVEGSYFEGNEYRFAGTVSGPISDKVRALLSGFYGHFDGNVRNLYTDQEVNGYEHYGVRGKVIANPTDALTITIGADYTRSRDTVPTGVWASASQTAYPTGAVSTNAALASLLTTEGIVPSADNRTVDANVNSNVLDHNGGVSVQADYDFGGGYRLTSITAWRGWTNVQNQDYDQLADHNSSLPQVQDIGHVNFHQTSQELRIASPKGRFVDFVAGLYYLNAVDAEVYERDVTRVISGADQADNGVNHYGVTGNNYAIFGEANVNLSKQLRVIAGFREVWDQLSFRTNRVSTQAAAITGVQPSFSASGSSTRNGLAGRVGIQYDFTPSINAYMTYSHGYKGPAYNVFFNEAAANTGLLSPETSNSYEAGIKSQLFDHRVQFDLAAFTTNFFNYQANSTQVIGGALVTNLVNAGAVISRGVEGDLIARPVRDFTFTANFAYDDAHVVNFPCPTGAAASCNINGKPLPFAPEWKLHFEGDYRHPVSDTIDVDLETEYNWQSDTQYQLGEFNDTIQPAYGIWNASLGLIGTRDGWSARVLIKNIADTHYSAYLSHGDLAGLVRWVPRDDSRYVGFSVHKDF